MTASGSARLRLALAACAVMLAAADTYVVVLALPAIMADVGITVDHLERAAPIISGFLLGYIALLPLLGRLSDILGRGRVLGGCLLAFGFGSLITASSHGLAGVVTGRTLQGMGGGGLVPVTLAIVADTWPEGRRGLPLGIVGAMQELGSVLGPLYGAAIITFTSWRVIFWVNLPAALLLGGGYALARGRGDAHAPHRRDVPGVVLGVLALAAGALTLAAPSALSESIVWGVLYGPLVPGVALTEPLALASLVLATAFCAWEIWRGPAAAVDLRRIPALWHDTDAPGALLLAVALGCIVVSFATADPSIEVLSPLALGLLPVAVLALALFVLRESRARDPIVPVAALRPLPAWGSVVGNLAVGAALIAALVDVPIFARAFAYHDSQVAAALVLLRFLVAVPIGALLGGLVCERVGFRATAAAGMLLSATMFVLMAQWGTDAVGAGVRASDAVLAACGLGFGLAIAPVNGAILGSIGARLHGLAAALVVVARMTGMLMGISLLTALGLRAFHQETAGLDAFALCPSSPLRCPAYDARLSAALLTELHTIFWGAAVCAALAAAICAATLRRGARSGQGGLARAFSAG